MSLLYSVLYIIFNLAKLLYFMGFYTWIHTHFPGFDPYGEFTQGLVQVR